MGKINFGRVILGGIVAGLVADLLSYIFDGLLLAPGWAAANHALGKTAFTSAQVLGFNLLGLVSGVLTIWLYAAAKPRLGSRYRTAVNIAFAVWMLACVIPNAAMMYVTALYPHPLVVFTTLGGLVEIFAGTFAGAMLYKDTAVPAPVAAAA